MAKPANPSAELAPSRRKFGLRDLLRLAVWGVSAAGALFVALYAGDDRDRPRPPVCGGCRNPRSPDADGRQADPPARRPGGPPAGRDRALARRRPRPAAGPRRHARTEPRRHHRLDRPGREGRADALRRSPAPSRRRAAASAPSAVRQDDVTSSINPPDAAPSRRASRCRRNRRGRAPPRPNSASTSAAPPRSRRLRTAWTAALRRHGPLLEGLRPVVQMRERPRPARHGIAPHRRPHPQRRDRGPALRQHDGGGRDLRARGVRRTASRRPLIAAA